MSNIAYQDYSVISPVRRIIFLPNLFGREWCGLAERMFRVMLSDHLPAFSCDREGAININLYRFHIIAYLKTGYIAPLLGEKKHMVDVGVRRFSLSNEAIGLICTIITLEKLTEDLEGSLSTRKPEWEKHAAGLRRYAESLPDRGRIAAALKAWRTGP